MSGSRTGEVVPNEMRVATYTAFGFLFVCLLNASGLMLARATRGHRDLALRARSGLRVPPCCSRDWWRRASSVSPGAARARPSCFGLTAEALAPPQELESVTRVGPVALASTLLLSVVVTVLAGAFPAWRASRRSGAARADVGNRAGAVFIGLQIALTLAIVSNGLLLAREHLIARSGRVA